MEELRAETLDLLDSLSEEQVMMVLAYARCLKDGEAAAAATALENLVEEPA